MMKIIINRRGVKGKTILIFHFSLNLRKLKKEGFYE
jgi:hypothetical protein